jgi:hypothetical protein
MILIELGDKEYKMPEGWNEVNLEMFERIVKLSSLLNSYKSEIEFSLDMFSILTGAPMEELKKLTRGGFETLSSKVEWVNTDIKPSGKKSFILDGEEWMPVDDLQSLSMGDSISMELMIKDSTDETILTNLLPVLIRRVKKIQKANGRVKKVPGDFEADKYEETKELFKKNLYVADVFQLKSFF